MKIATNNIGNYKPVITQRNNTVTKLSKNEKINVDSKISTDEKKFFTKLFPEQKEEITNYHFYNNKGNMNGLSIGSLFDKRG
ncbi:MAG: hypothetical protein V3V16_05860 [Melioribacteraceae bacterium]